MSIESFLTKYWSHLLLGLMTLIEITPIRINPWSWLGKMIGKFINASVFEQLQEIREEQIRNSERIEAHILHDDRRGIDAKRRAILAYNNELCRGIKHTEEAWIDILHDIDGYLSYCHTHPDYPNSRAEAAIANIKGTYQRCLQDGTFLSPDHNGALTEKRRRRRWFL